MFTDWSGAIYAVHPDGTDLSKVGTTSGTPKLVRGGSRLNFEPGSPSAFAPVSRLSPDGWRLATLDNDGVHIASADGSGSRLVSAEITQYPPMSRIVWSNDNRHLYVWGGQRALGFGSGALFDVDTGSYQTLPPGARTGVAVSPIGDRIAYPGPTQGLRVSRPDGSGAVDVSAGMEMSLYSLPGVSWSPDGERLAFHVAGADEGFAIAAADGSHTIRIGRAMGIRMEGFLWSPDGRHVALTGIGGSGSRRILVFDTGQIDAPPLVFEAGLTSSTSVAMVWWDNGSGLYFVGRGEYVGEGVAHEGVYAVSLDGNTDLSLSGLVDVASIVGVTR